MAKKYTHIQFVIDRSGSMGSCLNGTISGFNSYVEEMRKAAPGKCTLSLVQFDDQYEPNYSFKNLDDVADLSHRTYVPRGSTALVGAMGRTIDELGETLADMDEDDRPDKILFVVMTDGLENSSQNNEWSKKYTAEKVKDMVTHQRDKYQWQFVYLGANQDAFLEANKYGIERNAAMNFVSSDAGVGVCTKNLATASANYLNSATSVSANFFEGVQQDLTKDDGTVTVSNTTTKTVTKKH